MREQEISTTQYETDVAQIKASTPLDRGTFPTMQIENCIFGKQKETGHAIIGACKTRNWNWRAFTNRKKYGKVAVDINVKL